MQKEIGADAQQASARMVAAERRSAAESIREVKSKGSEQSKKEKEAHRESKRTARSGVGDSSSRAKTAMSSLSARRAQDAEEVRRPCLSKPTRSQCATQSNLSLSLYDYSHIALTFHDSIHISGR